MGAASPCAETIGGGVETRWLNARETQVWHSFLAAGALVGREVERQLEREGLSHTQYEVLVRLADAPEGRLRMTELADALYTSKSGLTYQVTQLEKAGLLMRETCPTDVRGVIAVLTAAGRERLAQIAGACRDRSPSRRRRAQRRAADRRRGRARRGRAPARPLTQASDASQSCIHVSAVALPSTR
ncbi:MarR family winged helix-turn-helix transcriptional regulator [Nocardia sp. NPDC003726]